MSRRSERDWIASEPEAPRNDSVVAEEPVHVEHSKQVVSEARPTGHQWTQRGLNMECPGGADHFAHGFRVPPELVFVREAADGSLVFKNVKTGKETSSITG
jgi:hypothetical protein